MFRHVLCVVCVPLLLAGLAHGEQGDADTLGQDMLPILAAYPKPVREAILKLAEHPALVAKLEKSKEPDKLLAGQPKDVQALTKYPVIFKVLQEHAEATAAIGKLYAKNPKKTIEDLDKEAEAESTATDEWTKRLGGDGDAIEQLQKAIAGYQKEAGGSAEEAANYAGVNMAGGNVNVTALPTPGFVQYTMKNADLYPALANSMTSQWLGSRNSAAYDRTFNHWWHGYENHFHDEHFLRGDEDRGNRLADLARYDKKFSKDDKRWDHFRDHAKDFPHAGKVKAPPKDHKRDPAKKPNVPNHEHKPAHAPEKGKHPAVHRGKASEHHQVHHAAHAHHGGGHHRK